MELIRKKNFLSQAHRFKGRENSVLKIYTNTPVVGASGVTVMEASVLGKRLLLSGHRHEKQIKQPISSDPVSAVSLGHSPLKGHRFLILEYMLVIVHLL